LTRDYLAYLRESMGKAAQNLEPFEEAYKNTDWSQFEHLPLFRVANRMNATTPICCSNRKRIDEDPDAPLR